MDDRDAYEQIRVEPEDVQKTLMTTPDGTMVSEVIQIGDTNAVATFMAITTDLPFIGVWMDVYLDDIVIYTDTLEEHVQRVKQVIDVLQREKFYLAEDKLHFLPSELNLLGHVITAEGIKTRSFQSRQRNSMENPNIERGIAPVSRFCGMPDK
jgi:hypothetical protein